MSKELVISSNRHETKVAILEDDQLVELYFQRANEYSLAGSIHKGRVTRVLPGMQSAFVDVGLERDTFLYVTDFFEEHHDDLDKVGGDERPPERVSEPRIERSSESGRDRDRDRGRGGRDRDRDRGPRPPAPVAAVAAAPMGEEAPVTEAAGEASVADGNLAGDEAARERDRRGRRGRRRGRRERGGGNLPDSKYASAGEGEGEERLAETEPVVSVVPPVVVEAAPVRVEPTGSIWAAPIVESIMLPGESLAKYRRQPVRPVIQHEAVVEPVAAKVENEAVVEQVLAQVEAAVEPEPPPFVVVVAPEPEPEPVVIAEPVVEAGPVAFVEPVEVVEAVA